MRRLRFVFVLEQTLGHVAHTRNIERVLSERPDVDATVIKVEYEGGAFSRMPLLRNWTLRASWAARAALRQRLAAGPVDAIFIHTQVASLMAGDVMRAVPTVVSLDATPANFDDQGAAYGHSRQSDVMEHLKRGLVRRSFVGARALVTWNRWARNSLVADYAMPLSKIMVIPPGVDTRLFRPAGGARPGRLRVLFVGGDLVRKGGTDLLEAMAGMGDVAELDLVTGSDVPSVPDGLVCRVHHGLKPQSPELVALYRSADVFALPTRGDCFPQVIAEAMACGLPVVASDVGAIPEAVHHGLNGLIVAPAAPEDLREALEGLLSDPARRWAMGQHGLAIARREHDAQSNCEMILDLMEACRTVEARSA